MAFYKTIISFVLLLFSVSAGNCETRASIAERVFLTVQRVQSSVAGRALAQASARIAAGDLELSQIVRVRQDTADLLEKRTKRIAVLAEETGAAAETRLQAAEVEIKRLRADIEELDHALREEFPSFLELTAPQPLKIVDIQTLLLDDEALLLSFSDETYTYLWAISKTGFDWHRADIGLETLESMVKQLRLGLSGSGDLRAGKSLKKKEISVGPKPFAHENARRIYREIFAPLEPVFRDKKHLMLVLDKALQSLPPAVLITDTRTETPSTATDLREIEWLIKRHALTTLPSVSALRALRTLPKVEKSELHASFAGFGDPLLGYRLKDKPAVELETDSVTTRGVYQNVLEVAELAPLPNTSRELRRLAATMGADTSTIFLAEQATETTVKNTDLSKTNVIAFATHGLLANGLPGLTEPALVFTPPDNPSAQDDALLTASEAAALKLSADLVILSACDTAGSDGTPGAEGLSGLARAFIYAGARSILVSHWPVDDYAASVLTTGMLDRMYAKNPRGRAEALQSSMLDLMQDTSSPRYAHPSIWAPFVVVGEGGVVNR